MNNLERAQTFLEDHAFTSKQGCSTAELLADFAASEIEERWDAVAASECEMAVREFIKRVGDSEPRVVNALEATFRAMFGRLESDRGDEELCQCAVRDSNLARCPRCDKPYNESGTISGGRHS